MKRILAGILSLCLMISLIPTAAFAEETVVVDETAVKVATYEELLEALKAPNANVVMTANITAVAKDATGYGKAGIVLEAGDVLDGANYKLTIEGANATWDCAVAMIGGTVKNLTIAGAFRGVFMPGANGDVVIDSCKLENVIYTFNSDAGSKDYSVTIKNTTLNGWTSFSDVHKSVTFEDCSFGEGNGYAYCRPYQATSFINCEFDKDFEFDTRSAPVDSIVFNSCEYNNKALGIDNRDMFFAGGSVVIDDTKTNVSYCEAKIGDTPYATLAAAVEAAPAGATVTVLDDIDVGNGVLINKTLTLDLNGKTLSSVDDAIQVREAGATVIITDSSADKTGKITSNGNNCGAVYVKNGEVIILDGTFEGTNNEKCYAAYASVDGTLVIKGGTFKAIGEKGAWGVVAYGAESIIIDGGEIISNGSGVSGNGTNGYETPITINGGTITAKGNGIYFPANSKLTITGGSITGATAVYHKSGDLEITGGTLTGNGAKAEYGFVSSGAESTGDALVIENVGKDDYEAIGTVSITGGTFASVNAKAVGSYTAGNAGVEAVKGFITGGTFSTAPEAAYVVTGYLAAKEGENYIVKPVSEIKHKVEVESAGEIKEDVKETQVAVEETENNTAAMEKIAADLLEAVKIGTETEIKAAATELGFTEADAATIAAAVANEEELTLVVVPSVEPVTSTTPLTPEEITEVEALREVVGDDTVVIDITVAKVIENSVGNEIASATLSETDAAIEITVKFPTDVPEVAEGMNRIWTMYSYHNGKILKHKITDNGDGTGTFASNKFSFYAIAYEDVDAHEHTWSDDFKVSENSHRRYCETCGAYKTKHPHVDVNKDGSCDACDYKVTTVSAGRTNPNTGV